MGSGWTCPRSTRGDKTVRRRPTRARCVLAARIIAMDEAEEGNDRSLQLRTQSAVNRALVEFSDSFIDLVRSE